MTRGGALGGDGQAAQAVPAPGAIGSVVYQSMPMVQMLVLILHQGFSFYLNFEFFFFFFEITLRTIQ